MAVQDPTIIIITGPRRGGADAQSEELARPERKEYQAARDAIDAAEAEGMNVEVRD